jgi:hypothetical protein
MVPTFASRKGGDLYQLRVTVTLDAYQLRVGLRGGLAEFTGSDRIRSARRG